MPAPNASTILDQPIFVGLFVDPSRDAILGSNVGPINDVILSLSKDEHEHDRETSPCRT
jgi:hypothetical protein